MQDREVFSLFIYECEQQVEEIDTLLFDAETAEQIAAESVAELFRLVHTMKGSAAMMGCNAFSETTHRAENVLQEVRRCMNQGQTLPPALWKEFIAYGFDFTAYCRDTLEKLNTTGEAADSRELDLGICRLMAALRAPDAASAAEAWPAEAAEASGAAQEESLPAEAVSTASLTADMTGAIRCRVYLQPCPMAALRGFLVCRAIADICERYETVPAQLQAHPEWDEQIKGQGFDLRFIPKADISEEMVFALLRKQPLTDRVEGLGSENSVCGDIAPAAGSAPSGRRAAAQGSQTAARVSVSQERINSLLDVMSEVLTLETALALRLDSAGSAEPEIEGLLHALNHYSLEVQSGLSELGMTEISRLFSRMQRLARDLLADAGKQADVRISGGDLPVDKSVMEAVNEMLLHVVRNAVDHGLETPEERRAAGKPERGEICLHAARRHERLRITVSDDGRGICPEKILAAAEKKGFLHKPAEAYTQKEIFDLLLVSGFTTKETVTQYSGRGVGLDAVQNMVRKIGGRMEMTSTPGVGLQVVFDLPLTLTVVDALCAESPDQTCYLPVSAVERVVPRSCIQPADGICTACAAEAAPAAGAAEAAVPAVLPEDESIRIGEVTYRPLLFAMRDTDAFLVLLSLEQGFYYVPCHRVGEYGTFLVKPLPPVLKRLLGSGNLYSGCIQDRLGSPFFLIDPDKAAACGDLLPDSRA